MQERANEVMDGDFKDVFDAFKDVADQVELLNPSIVDPW